MVKYESFSHVFSYAWEHVVTCFWKKYPNENSTHVLSEDVLDRKLLDENRLYTKRIIGKTNPLPKWGTTIFPSNMTKIAHVLEESIVDLQHKTMVSYTWNISYVTLMSIKEKIQLTANTSETTDCKKEGWADSSATGLRRVLRKFGITRWKSNAQKAVTGYEKVLANFDQRPKVETPISVEVKHLHIPKLSDNTIETIKDAKDKAKTKAIDLAALAAAKKAAKKPQNIS
uniref:PRELI domain-containing protein 1, mitochondrial-like n=1 Tax=Styela clava TaxID=7725 RepID=UPI001939A0F1|nr:PRELI domain-containing protein 1, mitochondrial-like [Styela clava]